MFRNVAGSARAAINGDAKLSPSQRESSTEQTQNEFCAEPVYKDDIEALLKDPRSPKAQEARSKLARVAVSDNDIWIEVRKKLRQGRVTTNMCASITFNDSILQDVVIKSLERNNKIETRPAEASAGGVLKFVRNPFTSGGTGVRAMSEEEALSSLRSALKKPIDPSLSGCIPRTGRRGSDPFSDRRSNRKMFSGSSVSGLIRPPSDSQGLDPCGRRDSKRGSFTMNIFAGEIPTHRSQSWNGTIMQVNENSNLYDVCRSMTLDQEEPSEAPQSFSSFVSTAMRRCSFNDKSSALPVTAACPDECVVPNRASMRRRRGNRSSWTAAVRRASSGISSFAEASFEVFGSEKPTISEEDEPEPMTATTCNLHETKCLLEDFPSTRKKLDKVNETPQISAKTDGSAFATTTKDGFSSKSSPSKASSGSAQVKKSSVRRGLSRSDSCLAKAA